MDEAPQLICYLLTFRTYGTWLHGDARGSVDRHRNTPGEPRIPVIEGLEEYERGLMKSPPIVLTPPQREACSDGIRRVATERQWRIFALNVRTNHVHLVIETTEQPKRVMRDLKVGATKGLRALDLIGVDDRTWARGGSAEMLATSDALARACRYVVEEQGATLGEMPDA